MNTAAPDPVPVAGLARRLRLAWAVVLVERLWPLLVPPVCLVGLFLSYALFDPVPVVPGWLHLSIVVLTALIVAGLLIRAIVRLHPPDQDAAARRLERDSGMDHRPLAVLEDRPVGDDPAAALLWQAHLRRTLARLGPLRLAFPRSDMAARDPWGLRAAVLLLLVIAVTGAWGDVPRRLSRVFDVAAPGGADRIEVWLTPPAYTGLSPQVLRPGRGEAVSVPRGTAVLALLQGGWGGGHLRLGEGSVDFQRQPDGGQRAEGKIESAGTLAVRQGLFTLARWPLTVTPDAAPVVAFAQPPEPGDRGRLRLALTVSDDYGLARAWVSMHREGEDDSQDIPLGLAPGAREARPGGWVDLSGHAWAGQQVILTPMAADGAGQTGRGEPVTITLPERQFLNPVAAAVAERRRALTAAPREMAREVAGFLDHLGMDPELFNDDLRAFLMLRLARHTLVSRDGFLLSEVRDLLWQAALRIEDGDLSSAERAVEEARAALESALDRGAPPGEIRALLEQFQQAVERLVQAAGQVPQAEGVPEDGGMALGEDELAEMMAQLRDLAESGSRDALREAVQQMAQLLGNLQSGGGQNSAAAAEALRHLRDLTARQQALQDDSRTKARDKVAADGGAARAQKDLHRALAETARDMAEVFGEPPQALGDAAQAMEGAAGQLARGDWDGAAELQGKAVAALNAATRDAAAKLAQSGGGGGRGMPRDPLGRALRGAAPGDDGATRIPGRAELQRSRQLLEEIRRRAGETARPEAERDYLRRLLRQF